MSFEHVDSDSPLFDPWEKQNSVADLLEFVSQNRRYFLYLAWSLKLVQDLGTERQFAQCRDEIEDYGRHLLGEWTDELSQRWTCSECKQKINAGTDGHD